MPKKKEEREIERWITVHGARVPIFKGQSVEEAIRESVGKRGTGKKHADEKKIAEAHKEWEKSQYGSFKPGARLTGIDNAKDRVDTLKKELKKHPDDMHTQEIKNALAKAQAAYNKFKKGEDGYSDKENFKTAKEWDAQEKQAAKKADAGIETPVGNTHSKRSLERKNARSYAEMQEEKRRREAGEQKNFGKKDFSHLSEHSAIQKMAEEHVDKIMNRPGGAANKELYDAADKFAEKYGLDKKKVEEAAFKAMNEKHVEALRAREKQAANKTDGEVKPYVMYQKENMLGDDVHSRLEVNYAKSKEEAMAQYKQKYPKAKESDVTTEISNAPEHTKKAAEINAANKTGAAKENYHLNADQRRAKETTQNAEAKDRYGKDWWGLTDDQRKSIDDQLKKNHPLWYGGKMNSVEKRANEVWDKAQKTAKTDGGENARIGVYKKQLKDVQEDIQQFESTPKSLRSKDYDQKLGELKKKEGDLKGWIDNDINTRRNEALKEKQLAANKAEAQTASGKRGSTPKFKDYNEAKEYYQKRFTEMSPQNMNRIARNMQIGGRGKEKIAALAEAKAKEWQKGSAVQEERDKQARHTAERVAQEQAYASMNQRRRELKEQRRTEAEADEAYDRHIRKMESFYERTGARPYGEDAFKVQKDLLPSMSAKKLMQEHVKSGGVVKTAIADELQRRGYTPGADGWVKKSSISKESAGAMSNVYDGGKKARSTSTGSAKPKYSKDEYVHVRIPAKDAGVPKGLVTRVQVHSVADDGGYWVRSAKYGLMYYSADEVHKKRKDVK